LVPGQLSPRVHQGLVRLGAWMPFGQAAAGLGWFTGAPVGRETARRLTEAAGAALVALEDAEAERLTAERPPPPAGPRVVQLSLDGAMVPLVDGEWAEVKLAAVGEVVASRDAAGDPVVRTVDVSYAARLADRDTFARAVLPEVHRRGVETASVAAAVADGSVWIQGVVDLHRPDAVRILDFAHTLEHLNAAAQACFGEGSPAAVGWLDQQATELKHGDPDAVLRAVRLLPVGRAPDPAAAAVARDQTLGYLTARRVQIAYAHFRRQGLPIGSGMVESGHKRVVQARLKGAGMRWQRANVNAMLALRCAVCNDRWDQAWADIARRLRAAPGSCPTRTHRPPGFSAAQAARPSRTRRPPRPRIAPMPVDRPKTIVDGKPTPTHAWNIAARRGAERKAARAHQSAKS
jgi:hypothetical protein